MDQMWYLCHKMNNRLAMPSHYMENRDLNRAATSNLGYIHSLIVCCCCSLSCINEYMVIDSGGYLYMDSLHTVNVTWLNAQLNKSARE